MNDAPLVTCLCLTMKEREKFLARAASCFFQQTYKNCHLLIVADSIDDVNSLFPSSQILWWSKRVSVITTPGEKLNIGQKRNLGCESAAGSDLIAVWDDDDYSAPCRIEEQVKYLRTVRKSVTACDELLFTDNQQWWRFSYPLGFGAGSSLMFRRDWWKSHSFDEGQYGMIGEDCRFITEAHEVGEFSPTIYREPFMYATIHPGNTSKKKTSEPGWVHLYQGFKWKD